MPGPPCAIVQQGGPSVPNLRLLRAQSVLADNEQPSHRFARARAAFAERNGLVSFLKNCRSHYARDRHAEVKLLEIGLATWPNDVAPGFGWDRGMLMIGLTATKERQR